MCGESDFGFLLLLVVRTPDGRPGARTVLGTVLGFWCPIRAPRNEKYGYIFFRVARDCDPYLLYRRCNLQLTTKDIQNSCC